MTTKRRSDGDGEQKTAKKTAKKTATKTAAGPKRTTAKKKAVPRIHASHAEGKRAAPRARPQAGGDRLTPKPRTPTAKKTPLAGPKRTTARRAAPTMPTPEASSAARELALALAAAGIDKKALGIEILDVSGKVDYADFLVVMTGRSDRHVHAIAMGIEAAMSARKLAPLSVEGLASATWVLIDFSDVVVHVFQEDARALYDIEGLWIDASRVPVPDADKVEGGGAVDAKP